MNAGHLLSRVKMKSKWRWSEGERGRVNGVFFRCLPNSCIAFLVGQALSDTSQ